MKTRVRVVALLAGVALLASLLLASTPITAQQPSILLAEGRVKIQFLGWLTETQPVIAVHMLPQGPNWDRHLIGLGFDTYPLLEPPLLEPPSSQYFTPLPQFDGVSGRVGALYLVDVEIRNGKWRRNQTLGARYPFRYWGPRGGELGFGGSVNTELFTFRLSQSTGWIGIGIHLMPYHALDSTVDWGWLPIPPFPPPTIVSPTVFTITPTPSDTPTPTNTPACPTPTPTITCVTPTPTATVPIWKCDGHPRNWSTRVILTAITETELLDAKIEVDLPAEWINPWGADASPWWYATVAGTIEANKASWSLGSMSAGEQKSIHLRFYPNLYGTHELRFRLYTGQTLLREIAVKINVQ